MAYSEDVNSISHVYFMSISCLFMFICMDFLGVERISICAKVTSQSFETRFLSVGAELYLDRPVRAVTAT